MERYGVAGLHRESAAGAGRRVVARLSADERLARRRTWTLV